MKYGNMVRKVRKNSNYSFEIKNIKSIKADLKK